MSDGCLGSFCPAHAARAAFAFAVTIHGFQTVSISLAAVLPQVAPSTPPSRCR